MKQLYIRMGISAQHLDGLKTQKGNNKCDAWRTFYDCVLLICPFLPIDGLGVVKFQPPVPREWYASSLIVREARIILRQRLNERIDKSKKLTTSYASIPTRSTSPFPSQLHWVCAVFNFFEQKYGIEFHKYWDVWHSLVGKNAHSAQGHDFVREVLSAAKDIDSYLASMFNQAHCMPTYIHLVATHQEMAIKTQEDVYKQIRDNPNKDKRSTPGFRTATAASPIIGRHHKTLQLELMEVVHRYVDLVMDEKTFIDSYRQKTEGLEDSQGRQPALLTDDQIRSGWYTMMLRACLWSMLHVGSCMIDLIPTLLTMISAWHLSSKPPLSEPLLEEQYIGIDCMKVTIADPVRDERSHPRNVEPKFQKPCNTEPFSLRNCQARGFSIQSS
jgi:hypothetical protein